MIRPLPSEDWPPVPPGLLQAFGKPLNVYGVLAHHPALLESWIPFRQHIVCKNSLAPRYRELVILRNAVNTGSEYEWRHHVVRGKQAGLTEAEIDCIKAGSVNPHWTETEVLLLNAVDELNREYKISKANLKELSTLFSNEELLDLLCTVGMYMTLACIANSCNVPVEEWLGG